MERDHMTEQEAKNAVSRARTEIYSAIEDGGYDAAEDIMYLLLGLEMDYIFDIL